MTATTPEAERRLTPTERLHEIAMSLADRRPSEPVTVVKTGTNAKGELVYREVSVAARDPFEALRVSMELTDALAAKYPAPVANGDAPKIGPTTKGKGKGPSDEVPF